MSETRGDGHRRGRRRRGEDEGREEMETSREGLWMSVEHENTSVRGWTRRKETHIVHPPVTVALY